jgi:SAM-dependent methyltransferase
MPQTSLDRDNSQLQREIVDNCPVCNGGGVKALSRLRDRLFDVPGEWTLWRCSVEKCGTFWLNPRVTLGEIPTVYRNYFTHTGPSFSGDQALTLEDAIIGRRLHLHPTYTCSRSQALGFLAGTIPSVSEYYCGRVMWLESSWRGRLLDVGCGAGDLLLRMKRYGWEVEGIEPDPIAAAELRKFGLRVIEGTLPNNDLRPASFDVITASHVIEHVPDPVAFLAECFALLRSNGRIVLATPNVESDGFRKFGNSWVHLDPPRHLVLFTPTSLELALRKAAFKVEQVTTSCRSAYFVSRTSRALKRGAMRIGDGCRSTRLEILAAMIDFLREGFLGSRLRRQEIVAVGVKR